MPNPIAYSKVITFNPICIKISNNHKVQTNTLNALYIHIELYLHPQLKTIQSMNYLCELPYH